MFKRIKKCLTCNSPTAPIGSRGSRNCNSSKCLFVVLMMALGIIHGCATVPVNVAAPVPPAELVGDSSLASGRKIYVSMLKCAMCHRPKPVSDYSVETWTEDILPRMSKKARLSQQQYADVLAYVTSTTTQR